MLTRFNMAPLVLESLSGAEYTVQKGEISPHENMRNPRRGGARLSLVVGSPPELPAVQEQNGIFVGKVPVRTSDNRIIWMDPPSVGEQMQRLHNRQTAGLL